MKYEWKYGENLDCNYYEVNLGKDYLSVYSTKKYPNVWMGMYTKGDRHITLMDKTFNDGQRKKESEHSTLRDNIPSRVRVLTYDDAEKMQKKLIYAYKHGLEEITR